MIKPKPLIEKSTIGVISPSYWLDEKILSKTRKFFERNEIYKKIDNNSFFTKKNSK